MQHIDSLGHTYCIRLKRNIKVFVYDKKEGHKVWKFLDEIEPYKYHSKSFNNILLTDNSYKTNIVISTTDGVSELGLLLLMVPLEEPLKIMVIVLVLLNQYLKIKNLMAFILNLLLKQT